MKKIVLIFILVIATAQLAVAYPGSYQQTCRACYTQQGTLYCKCQKANGRWKRTQIDRPRHCNRITNENGRLSCKGRGRAHHGDRPRPQPRRQQPPQNTPKQIRKDVRKGNWTPNQLLNS